MTDAPRPTSAFVHRNPAWRLSRLATRFPFPGQEALDRCPSIVPQALRAQSVGKSGTPYRFDYARVDLPQPQRRIVFAGALFPLNA